MRAQFPERPIRLRSEDKLERRVFVSRLADALVDPKSATATGVVVGLTGAWGSGKSSILNMLDDEIRERYRTSFVVRFDPWLISGRNDLIVAFFAELGATLASHEDRELAAVKDLLSVVSKYASKLAPLARLVDPSGLAAEIAGAGASALNEKLGRSEELSGLRSKLLSKIRELKAPIVVLIDELDRVEDAEIRAIAQLVRSVLDFPGISYLLAYDQSRVVQALGVGSSKLERLERGRSYLEKIVQLPIALPVLFFEERQSLLASELEALQASGLPKNLMTHERFARLSTVLADRLVTTPRDVKRVVGVFHVLHGMVGREVDWVDLLGFSVLQARYPATVELMRHDIDRYVDNPASTSESMKRMVRREKGPELFEGLVAREDDSPQLRKLLSFLFPAFGGERQRDHLDPISYRRGLLTVVRLGLVEGVVSRKQLDSVLRGSAKNVAGSLIGIRKAGKIGSFVERLDNFYGEKGATVRIEFWKGVSNFLVRPAKTKPTDLVGRRDTADEFAGLLRSNVRRSPALRGHAREVFQALAAQDDIALVPEWMRLHSMALNRGEELLWLSDIETLSWRDRLCRQWKKQLIEGQLVDRLVDMHPIYTMMDANFWDEAAQEAMIDAAQTTSLDALVVLMFGGIHTVDQAILDRMFGDGIFKAALLRRAGQLPKDEVLVAAITKATHDV